MQKSFLSSHDITLLSGALSQSLHVLVCCAGIYSLFCCSKGRGVTHCWICQGNVTELLFPCVSHMFSWLAHCWHTSVSVMKTNTWYFHPMVYARGINIQWDGLTTFPTKSSSVGMCTEAVFIKQLTCCKFTSYSLHPAVSYSSAQIKMPSLAIHP